MQNTQLSQRQENPNYLPWIIGAGVVGFGAWYFFYRDKGEEKEEEEGGGGVVGSASWGTSANPKDAVSVKVEKDYSTFVPTTYPGGLSVEADPLVIQVSKQEKVQGGMQIEFTPLKTGLASIRVAPDQAGFGDHLLKLNISSFG